MSPTYFKIVALFHKRLPNSFKTQNSDFSSIGGSGKGGYEAESENKYCENCGQCGWKVDLGEVNPYWLCEEFKLFWKLWL